MAPKIIIVDFHNFFKRNQTGPFFEARKSPEFFIDPSHINLPILSDGCFPLCLLQLAHKQLFFKGGWHTMPTPKYFPGWHGLLNRSEELPYIYLLRLARPSHYRGEEFVAFLTLILPHR